MHLRREAAVDAEELFVHDRSKGERVADVHHFIVQAEIILVLDWKA